jgi:CheY-like chemotaxis protein
MRTTAANGLSGPRIFVVEDDQPNRDVLMSLLTLEGYQVAAAASGEEALSLFKNNKPDLILCDYLLKDMDGAELCERLSRHPLVSGTPMILVTGMPLVSVRNIEQYIAVVEKPYEVDELLHTIRSALTLSGTEWEERHSGPGS